MKIQRLLIAAIVLFCTLLISVAWAGGEGQYSGFLDDYPKFEPDKDRKGALIYSKPGVGLESYTKIMIDPIEIWIAKDSKYKGIKPDEMKTLADEFRKILVDALEPDYPVVSKPGAGVLGIRLAITNVELTKKKRGLLGYTPIGLVVSAGVKAVGENMSLQDASIEAELLDSQSNERIGALIDQQSKTGDKESTAGKLRMVQAGATSWEEVESTLKFYAQRFRGRLDAEHGR